MAWDRHQATEGGLSLKEDGRGVSSHRREAHGEDSAGARV